jgi:hypothetical protein
VVDELSVDPRDRWEDDEIRGAALQALMLNDDVPDRIDVCGTARGELAAKPQHPPLPSSGRKYPGSSPDGARLPN